MLLALSATACSSSSSGSGSKKGNPAAAQACRDMADAVARWAARCGQDYQGNYSGFIDSAAAGDCNNIVGVRDEAALRDVCLPYFETLDCSYINSTSVPLPDECKSQLLRVN